MSGGRRSGIERTAKSAPLAAAFETRAAVNVDAPARPSPPNTRSTMKSDGHLISKDVRTRKSTRLNSSHVSISYAVFCLKKKKKKYIKLLYLKKKKINKKNKLNKQKK